MKGRRKEAKKLLRSPRKVKVVEAVLYTILVKKELKIRGTVIEKKKLIYLSRLPSIMISRFDF